MWPLIRRAFVDCPHSHNSQMIQNYPMFHRAIHLDAHQQIPNLHLKGKNLNQKMFRTICNKKYLVTFNCRHNGLLNVQIGLRR